METPDWTHFRSADIDPSGSCCLLENAFPVRDLPRNYIWVIGEHHPWKGGEDAEITAQVKSYSRAWLNARQAMLQRKRDELTQQQAKLLELKRKKELETRSMQVNTMKDEAATKQRIEAGPMKMARSLIQSAADLATGGVTDPAGRMEICNQCPFKGDDQRCGKCGCFLPAKTRVKKSTCPIGRW